ncbi:MAG: hypothetical protein M1129_04230 [Candidatus Thermoplasmatota archaeon]|jgi:hypothetical protein|nr:hypothetical protein [Candidatus Thermoplasmatota archaeon]
MNEISRSGKKLIAISVIVLLVLTSMPLLRIASGQPVTVPKEPLYIRETGLATGTSWTFNVTEQLTSPVSYFTSTQTNTSYNLTGFVEKNYAYNFTASSNGYSASYIPNFTASGPVYENITFTPIKYNVTVSEFGLTSGTSWSFTFNGTSYTLTNTSYVFREPDGTYSFSVSPKSNYQETETYPNSIPVSGSNVSQVVEFTAKPPNTYELSVDETGLTNGTAWSFTLNGTSYDLTNSSYVFHLQNGTYTFFVPAITGYRPQYSSSITINGSNAQEDINFRTNASFNYFIVYITETGLPSGTNWTYTFNGSMVTSSQANHTYSVLNGTYNMSVQAISGYSVSYQSQITVNGSDYKLPVNFTKLQPRYNVTVNETGLPSGTTWSFTFNGTLYTLTNSSYTFSVVNGNYDLSVNAVSGYTDLYYTPIDINNASQTDTVSFTKIQPTYEVIIQEGGLPGGTPWSFTFNGSRYNLTNASYDFQVKNGTYNITVKNVTGYTVSYPSYVTMSGSSQTVTVNFSPVEKNATKYSLTIDETGLPSGTEWSFTFNGTSFTLSNTSYTFLAKNGTYTLTVYQLSGYNDTYPSDIIVSGQNQTVNVVFTKSNVTTFYVISANETGLPIGTIWYLYINDTRYQSNTSTMETVKLPNGTYNYTVSSSNSNYRAVNGTGNITVDGSPFYIGSVSFVSVGGLKGKTPGHDPGSPGSPVPGAGSGNSFNVLAFLEAVGIFVVIAAGVLFLIFKGDPLESIDDTEKKL